jgi:hypothetical protein
MTLNITVLTPNIIYQSADFKISNVGKAQLTFNPSPKTLGIGFSSWRGLLTYTGVGYWRGRDMSAIVADWLTGLQDVNMMDVARIIETEGTKVLRDYERFNAREPHTFVLAGFEDDQPPRVFVISNRENCFSIRRETIDDHLSLTTRRLASGGKTIVIVTGQARAVPTEARRELQSVVSNYPDDSFRIRNRIAKLNADAVKSGRTGNAVSEDCVVLSLRSDGSSVMQLNRDATESPAVFPQIEHGVNIAQQFTDTIKQLGLDLSQIRAVQGFSGTLSNRQSSSAPAAPCNYGIKTPDQAAGYSLREIASDEFQLVSCKAVNNTGQIIGTGRFGRGQAISIPWSWCNQSLERLNFAGSVVALNDRGQVAAYTQTPEGERAALFENGSASQLSLYHGETGIFAGTDSQAFAINDDSLVVGSMRSKQEERIGTGHVNSRAAVFQLGHPTVILGDLTPQYGCHAVDVNERHCVLVCAGVGHFDVRSIVWDLNAGSWSYVGDDKANVYPMAMNNENIVLGQARNAHGHPVAVICTPGGAWQRLGTADGWIPVGINDRGEVLGRAKIEDLDRPWLWRSGGQLVMLPYLTNHNHNPQSINNGGQIVGGALADDDLHAVVWEV